MSRIPLGRRESETLAASVGILSSANPPAAQDGSTTGLVGAAVRCSAPPKPLLATGLPVGNRIEDRRDRISRPQILLRDAIDVGDAHCFRSLSTSSSGELRPSAASAFDQRLARPGIELRSN